MRSRPLMCLTAAAALLGSAGSTRADDKDDKAVQKRVHALIAVFADPEARSSKLPELNAAKAELTKIGAPAARQLVATLLEEPASSNISFSSGQVLLAIGKPALPAVMARWGDLNDHQRWRLMEFREKHDREAAREYVWNCLASDDEGIRLKAWSFNLRHPDPRAKDRYLNALQGKEREHGGEDARLRWWLLSSETVYDEKTESDILIWLLNSESWVAKGEGAPLLSEIPPPWAPDGRPWVINIIKERKLTRAAPELLKVLKEKGEGLGYLVETIVPVLVEFKYKEAIPELGKIAASKPHFKEPAKANLHPYALSSHKDVQKLAAEAAKMLREEK